MKKSGRSPRLPGYDYSDPGIYFVTICTWEKETSLCSIRDGRVYLKPLGVLLQQEIHRTAELRDHVILDEYVIMPDHAHLLLEIVEDQNPRPAKIPDLRVDHDYERAFGQPTSRSLSSIIGTLKAAVTRVARRELPDCPDRIWQPKFHDRIIRTCRERHAVRRYIRRNPENWNPDT